MARRDYDPSTPGGRLGLLIQTRWKKPANSFADAVGINSVTLSRLVNGTSELRLSKNLGRIAKQLGVEEGVILYGPIDHYLGSPPGRDEMSLEDEPRSATEKLLALLKLHSGTRRIAGVLSQRGQTLLTVAYTIALDDNWPVEEIRKIDALRDEIMEETKSRGS